MRKHRVVVTGLGVVAPNAVGVQDFKDALYRGVSGIRYIDELKELNYRSCVGGVPPLEVAHLEKYLPEFYTKKISNKGVIYASLAGVEAWNMAGFGLNPADRLKDVGIVFGSGALGLDSYIGEVIEKIDSGRSNRLGSRSIPQGMSSGASAYLNQLIGAGNEITSNSSACITGSEAILVGYEKISSGQVTKMVCGSTEGNGRFIWAGFDAMRVLCSDANDNPSFASRPMSDTSSGFAPASGSGAVILETLESAQERGATIYAEVMGGHRNCGGLRNGGSMTAQNPEAVAECIQEALKKSEVDGSEIDLISGHLTSTKADPNEIENWMEGLGRSGEDFPFINTPKSMIGHCIGGAGSIESVAAILQLHHGFIHKNINLTEETIHPRIKEMIPTDKVVLDTSDKEINTVIKSNFGFGDLNCCLIFKRYQ